MVPVKGKVGRVLARNWVLVGVCWYFLWGTGQPARGQPPLAPTEEKLSPQAWLQQYLGMEFPDSARHFTLHYRSNEEDVVLFSFDVPQDDLAHLLDGRGILPSSGDLTRGDSNLPEQIVRDPGSEYFAQKVAALPHARSATRKRARPTEPREVRLWTSETPAGPWEVCVSLTTDKPVDKADVPGGFQIPAAAQNRLSHVVIDSRRPRYGYGTSIWQRWTLADADYREFLATTKARPDVERFSGVGAERLVAGLTARGPAPPVPWWRPAELEHRRTGSSEPVQAFSYKGSDDMTAVLVAGRADGLLCCYAYTQRNVLVPDPRDEIPGLLGLPLPARAREAHCESASSMAGIVSWIRFDLPLRDWVTCLARTTALPKYANFAADAALKEYLETGYDKGAPPWWRPEELQEGLYAQRKSSMKDLHDVTVGFGPLPAESVRVYIGAFSAW